MRLRRRPRRRRKDPTRPLNRLDRTPPPPPPPREGRMRAAGGERVFERNPRSRATRRSRALKGGTGLRPVGLALKGRREYCHDTSSAPARAVVPAQRLSTGCAPGLASPAATVLRPLQGRERPPKIKTPMNLRPSESRFFVSDRHINDGRLIGFLGPLRATTADRHETTNPEQREGAGGGNHSGVDPKVDHLGSAELKCVRILISVSGANISNNRGRDDIRFEDIRLCADLNRSSTQVKKTSHQDIRRLILDCEQSTTAKRSACPDREAANEHAVVSATATALIGSES